MSRPEGRRKPTVLESLFDDFGVFLIVKYIVCYVCLTHTHILAGTGSGPLPHSLSPLTPLDNPVSLPQGPLQTEFENPALVHVSLSLTFTKLGLERPQEIVKHPKAKAQAILFTNLNMRL